MAEAFEWTPERIAALIALWEEGLTTSVIGERLGITKNAVVGKVHRLGLPKRVTSTRAPAPVEEKPMGEMIKLDKLSTGMCCWPDGEPGSENFRFCGAPAVEGKPYCTEHCRRAYVRITKDGRKVAAA
ncbi:MAG: GcrA family cell cycle regulator [Rhodospirillales bacterium]